MRGKSRHKECIRGARRTCTSRTGWVRTTGAVPMPFQASSNHLDGLWTGRSGPVQGRQCMSVTAVQTVGQVDEVSHSASHLPYDLQFMHDGALSVQVALNNLTSRSSSFSPQSSATPDKLHSQ